MAKRLYVWTTQHSKKRKIQTPILMTPFGATRTDPSHIPFTYWTIWLRCCCALVVVVVAVVSLRVYVFCFDLILCYCMGGWLAGCSIIVFKQLYCACGEFRLVFYNSFLLLFLAFTFRSAVFVDVEFSSLSNSLCEWPTFSAFQIALLNSDMKLKNNLTAQNFWLNLEKTCFTEWWFSKAFWFNLKWFGISGFSLT